MTSLAATAGRARTRPLLLRPNLLRGLWAAAASGAVVFGIVVLIRSIQDLPLFEGAPIISGIT